MKNPQGIPSKNCPTVKTSSELAYPMISWGAKEVPSALTKKEMKMVAFISKSPSSIVHR